MNSRNPLKRRLAVAACLVSSSSLFAQNAALGSIGGVVRDATGAVVPNATVVVTNSGTGATRTLTTDSDGHYVATFLQPGSYQVVLSGTGYGKIEQQNVAVTVGSTNTVDATLPNGSVTTDVVVTTDNILVDTEKTQSSQTVGQQLVANLPVNGRRWDNFVLLTPNVAPDGNTGLISYRGISGIYNTNLVDGANNQQAFFSEARGRSIGAPYVFPLDAIQEFESSVSSYSAELGQSAGGVINAITKSGTNQFHGDVFEYYRTPGFNALDPLNKYQGRLPGGNPLLLIQPVKVQHQFGASVGGPILRDRLFFHATYDGYRRVNPITYLSTYNNGTTSIPQLAGLCDGRTTGFVTRGSGATQAIYPSTIPGISPAQCTAATDFISSTQLGAFTRNTTQDIYFPRLDYQLTSKTHLSASFLFENLKIPNGYNSSTTVSNGGISQNGGINFHERFLTANAETVLTPHSSNVVHFQWSRDLETASTNSGGPAISLTNLFAYGETAALPRGAFPDEHRWQITDIYSTTRGRHSLKAGVDVNLIHEQIANLFQGDGSFSYNTGTPEFNFSNWVQDVYGANGGRHYNNFTQVTDPLTGVGADDFWNKDLDVFVEDNWKVTPSLLLSLGARYDVQLVPQPDRPNQSSGVASAYTSTINTDYHMAAPRIGFAYNPSPGTVVRGGYGIFYGLTSNSTFYTIRRENGVYQQQFNVNALTNPNSPYVPVTGAAAGQPNRAFQQSGTYAAFAPQGGVPAFTPPGPAPVNQVTGESTAAVNPGLPTSILSARGLASNYLNPFSHSWDLTVEQQLPLHSTLTMAYVGNRGMRLPVFVDTNVDPTSASTARPYTFLPGNGAASRAISVPIYSRRLAPTTGSVLAGFSDVNASYHSLAVTVRKPISYGVEILANYTWAKTLDGGQVSGVNGTFNGTDTPLDPFARGARQGRSAEYARSDLDQRGRFVGSVVATSKLPVANRYAAYAVNGFQVSGTFTAQTGFPLTAFLANSPVSAIGDGGLSGAALSLNNAGTPARVPSEIAGRNAFTGPGVHNLDTRVSRMFPFFREGMRLELAVEAFNIVNHRNILAVTSTAYSYQTPTACGLTGPAAAASAGCIVPFTSTPFATPTSTSSVLYGPRQLQLLGKLYF